MMKRLSILFMCLGLMWCTISSAQAQQSGRGQFIREARSDNRTDARLLFQAWRNIQRQNSRRIQRISLRERFSSRFDGPGGAWMSTVDLNVSGFLSNTNWQNDVTAFRSDGESKQRSEWTEYTTQWRNLLQPFASIVEDPALPLHLFDQMRPTGNAKEERVNGAVHWRIEMVPNRANVPYQRVTLWIHKEVGYLTRSRAVVANRRSSIEVITDYKRISNIDVPVRRTFDGKVQTRRRNRTYTVFFDVQGEYTNYSFR